MAKYIYECGVCGHRRTFNERPRQEPMCCGVPMRPVGTG